MKIKVWDETNIEKPMVFLRLRWESDDTVVLIAVDHNGRCLPAGNILRLDGSDGSIYRFKNVNEHLGFTLDDAGRIVIQ